MKRKRIRPPKTVWVLFDKRGYAEGHYSTKEEAESGAWGPLFRPFAVRQYALVPVRKAKP